MRKAIATVVWVGISSLCVAGSADAVVLLNSADRNTDPPGSLSNRGTDGGVNGGGDARDLLDSGWQYEGTFNTGAGFFLGTAIAPNYFITANHVNLGTTFTYHGTDYAVTGSTKLANSDLRVFSVSGTFDSYAPLWNESVDGSEVGRKMVIIGRGTQRGAEVRVNGVLKGWQWGTDDHVQSWGTNVVSSVVDASSDGLGQLMTFDFDATGDANEGALSAGDSGGAVFLQSGGSWKLAGINYGVDSPFSLTDGGATFNADLFDYGGLYFYDASTGKYEYQAPGALDQPVASYASLISSNLSGIQSVTGLSGSIVPEPAGLLGLTMSLAATTLRRTSRRK